MMGRGRPLLRHAAFAALGSPTVQAAQLGRVRRARALTILNLHRVDDAQGSAYEALKPALFDAMIGWLKARFRIVTFAELETLAAGAKPPLILSFDDGYKDFIEVAAPILRKHGVRANQNVIPGCVESGRPPMNVILQDFIGTAPAALLREVTMPGLDGGLDPDDRVRSGIRASALLKMRPIADQKAIFAVLERHFERFDGFRTTPLMTATDVEEIAAEHEIGAHSWEHATMSAETDAYLADDAARCRDWCRRITGAEPRIYTFPNGAVREGQAQAVRTLGYSSVLLVGEDFSRPDAWLHRRFTIHASTPAEARFRATGGLRRPQPARTA